MSLEGSLSSKNDALHAQTVTVSPEFPNSNSFTSVKSTLIIVKDIFLNVLSMWSHGHLTNLTIYIGISGSKKWLPKKDKTIKYLCFLNIKHYKIHKIYQVLNYLCIKEARHIMVVHLLKKLLISR